MTGLHTAVYSCVSSSQHQGSEGADLEEEGLHLVLDKVEAYLIRQQRIILPQQRELLHNLFEVSTDLFRYPGGPRQLLNPDAKSEQDPRLS